MTGHRRGRARLDGGQRRPGHRLTRVPRCDLVRVGGHWTLLAYAVVYPLLPQDFGRLTARARDGQVRGHRAEVRAEPIVGVRIVTRRRVHQQHVCRFPPEILGWDDREAAALAQEPGPRLEPERVDGPAAGWGVQRDDPRPELVAHDDERRRVRGVGARSKCQTMAPPVPTFFSFSPCVKKGRAQSRMTC